MVMDGSAQNISKVIATKSNVDAWNRTAVSSGSQYVSTDLKIDHEDKTIISDTYGFMSREHGTQYSGLGFDMNVTNNIVNAMYNPENTKEIDGKIFHKYPGGIGMHNPFGMDGEKTRNFSFLAIG